MDFNDSTAVLYWRGYKAQIFKQIVDEKPHHHKHVKLTVKYTFESHMGKIDAAVSKLEHFFPGLQVRSSRLFCNVLEAVF